MRTASRYIIAAACLVLAHGWASGQVRVIQYGQALDANLLVGSGGQNVARYTEPVNSQLFVTRQVSGLAGFRGSVAYSAPDQLNLTLPSAGLDTFTRQSVGLGDVTSGSPYMVSPFYERSSTIPGLRDIAAGRAFPGTNVPTSVAPAPEGLYGQVGTAIYDTTATSHWQRSPGTGLGLPPGGTRFETFDDRGQLHDFGEGAGLFAVSNAAERVRLARELSEVTLPENLAVETEIHTRVDRTPEEQRMADLQPAEWAPEPEDPNAQLQVRQRPIRSPEAEGMQWQPGEDVFSDILARLSGGPADQNVSPLAKFEKMRQPTEPNAPSAPGSEDQHPDGQIYERPIMAPVERQSLLTPRPPRGIVEYTAEGRLLIHGLAGRGHDKFNMLMSAAEAKLKAGEYREAVETYRQAVTEDRRNPLGRLGLAVALFAAGQPSGAAYQLRRAAQLFPPILSSGLDLAGMVDTELITRRLDYVEQRMSHPQAGGEPMLYFIAAYIHANLGHDSKAYEYAQKMQGESLDDKVLADYAASLLVAKRPTSAPATAPGG